MIPRISNISVIVCSVLLIKSLTSAQTSMFSFQQRQPTQLLQSQNFNQQRQQLIVSQSPNGQGIQVFDRATYRQLVDTNNLQEIEDNVGDNDLDDRMVGGLLDWLEKLKEKWRKKKGKKEDQQQQQKLPIIVPVRPEKQERKEIHIHINNHIKHDKHKKHQKQPPKKHGHYKEYHEGHHGHDDHDKHYHGKHSYPLLGHHFDLGDFYGYPHGGHDYGHGHDDGHHHGDHSGGGGHDDYSGYESKKVTRYATNNRGERKQKKSASNNVARKRTVASAI